MELRIFQKGFNFSRDGPGNQLVYHLQGCNLSCPWCSNPEGLACRGGTRVSVSELKEKVLLSVPMFFEDGGAGRLAGIKTSKWIELTIHKYPYPRPVTENVDMV